MGKELIDRPALERIIHRAAELQAGEREIGDGLTEHEVLRLGNEVGIPDRYLRQALLEESSRGQAARARGVAAWLVGSATLSAERVAPGDCEEIEEAASAWMAQEEALATIRRAAGHLRWERQQGFTAELRRAFGSGGRPYVLARADHISAQVKQLEEGFCHVRLEANVERQRSRRFGGALALLATGAIGTLIAATLGFALPLAAVPAVLGATLSLAQLRRHRFQNARIEVGLEQVLDRLERGEIKAQHQLPPPSGAALAINRITEEIRKAFGH